MKLWAFIYYHNGKQYSFRLHGTEEEAEQHISNFRDMGIDIAELGQVTGIVDFREETLQ